MKATILKKGPKKGQFGADGDVVEVVIGGKMFFLYARAADLYLEKKGSALMEVAIFRNSVEGTVIRIQ